MDPMIYGENPVDILADSRHNRVETLHVRMKAIEKYV